MKLRGCVFFCWVVGVLAAEEGNGEWSVRGYALPQEGRQGEFGDELKRADLLTESEGEPDAEKIKVLITEVSKICREHLKGLPEGSLVVVDPKRKMLAARTTEEGHDVIWEWLEGMYSSMPRTVAMQVNLLEVKTTEVGALLEETAGVTDHTAALERMEKAGARVVASASLETKSGQRAKTEMVTKVSHVIGFAARADGSTEGATRDVKPVGLAVEVDPVLGADGRTLDLNVAIQNTSGVGARRVVPLGTLAGKRVKGEVQDFTTEGWTTATAMLTGQSRLLGAAPAEDATMTRVCFLTANSPRVHVAMEVDGRAESWLKQYGDSVEPLPAGAQGSNKKVPPGMVKKVFQVPGDFLLMGGDSSVPYDSSKDPFAPSSVAPSLRRQTALEMLKEQGITFSPGSSATYLARTGELTAVNTPAMVDLVQTFVDSILYCPPAVLQFRLHVMEAGSAVVRKLGREGLGVTDHRVAWKAMQAEVAAGRGRLVGSAAIETKSGQRCTLESGRSYAWVDANLKAQVPDAKADKGSVAVTGVPVAELVASVEREPLGLRWEIDPVLGADGYTIDVNMAVKRQSRRPEERFEGPVAAEGVVRVDAPAVDFHPMELTTAFTTQDGMWRMIGTWQPAGEDGKLSQEVMQAVFVRGSVVTVGGE